jgi:hypothetical protein
VGAATDARRVAAMMSQHGSTTTLSGMPKLGAPKLTALGEWMVRANYDHGSPVYFFFADAEMIEVWINLWQTAADHIRIATGEVVPEGVPHD